MPLKNFQHNYTSAGAKTELVSNKATTPLENALLAPAVTYHYVYYIFYYHYKVRKHFDTNLRLLKAELNP